MSTGFEQLFDNSLSTLNTECIDSFRELVSESVTTEFSKIDEKYKSHKKSEYSSQETRQFREECITDDAIYLNDVSNLAAELSIVALYKLFEKKHKGIISFHKNETSMKKYGYWDNVKQVIPSEVKNTLAFNAVNELRLVNNCIKHEGEVSEELANEFPDYGKAGDDFTDLDEVFQRLQPSVIKYINNLHLAFKRKEIIKGISK